MEKFQKIVFFQNIAVVLFGRNSHDKKIVQIAVKQYALQTHGNFRMNKGRPKRLPRMPSSLSWPKLLLASKSFQKKLSSFWLVESLTMKQQGKGVLFVETFPVDL